MAKLPYTWTICPDQEAPKQFTASCKDMGELLRHSPNGDLTINQKRTAAWDMWSGNHMGHIEEVLHEMTKKEQEHMRYEQAKPLVQKLMEIAVLYHGSPSMLRKKISTAVCEGIPELDPACMDRGCPMVETFPPKEKA